MACINVFGEITFHAISDCWNSSKSYSDANPLSSKRAPLESKHFQKTTESGIIDETSDSRISRTKANYNSVKTGTFSFSNSLEPNGVLLDNEENDNFGGFQHQKWRSSKTASDSLSGFGEKSQFSSRSDSRSEIVSSKPIEFDRKCAWDILWASVSILKFHNFCYSIIARRRL